MPKFIVMIHPFEEYRKVGHISFIKSIDFDFYTGYYNFLNNGLFVGIDKAKEGIQVQGFDAGTGEEFSTFITIYTFFEQEYSKLENKARSIIDKIILEHLDDKKQTLFIKSLITELQLLQENISHFELSGTDEKFKTVLIEKIKLFAQTLGNIYLGSTTTLNAPKIQWLGNTNVLATLIYDLWQGQDKGKNNATTKPQLKADKKDLENLLLNNFIDKTGKPLSVSTISDYLNTSKSGKRAKEGLRIELNH